MIPRLRGAGESAAGTALLRRSGLLQPHQARHSFAWPCPVPAGCAALRLRLAFAPAVVDGVRNLLTLTLFDPHRFRGAGHRHAPQQDVLLTADRATPGFLPGPLPEGTWTVELDCHCVLPSDAGGVEFDLEVVALAEAPPVPGSGALPAVAERAPPASGPRWLRGDLHLHTAHSDGRWSVDEVVRYVRTRSLDFISVTDHNTTSPTPEVAGAAARLAPGLVVVPGMELTTFFGHANALGVPDWIDWRVAPPDAAGEVPPEEIGGAVGDEVAVVTRTMAEAAAAVHRLGGTFVVNHPRAPGYPHCTGCRWEFGDETPAYADAVEVWNGPWRQQNVDGLALWDRWLSAGHRIPACAGSDGHLQPRRPEATGYTCVFARPEPAAILAAVRAGRSYLSCGPALVLRHPAPGDALPPGTDALDLTLGGLTQPVDLTLVADGTRVSRRPVVADGDLAVPLPPGPATWYRLEVRPRDSDTLLAMTNPIFAPPSAAR